MGCHSYINDYVFIWHAEYRNDFIWTNPTFRLSLIDRNNAKQNFQLLILSPFIFQQLQYNLYNARELFSVISLDL